MLATFTAHLVALVGKEHVIAFLKKTTGQARQGSARYPTLEKNHILPVGLAKSQGQPASHAFWDELTMYGKVVVRLPFYLPIYHIYIYLYYNI